MTLVTQAIARSHRIGQKREVRVIHLEAVADPLESQLVRSVPHCRLAFADMRNALGCQVFADVVKSAVTVCCVFLRDVSGARHACDHDYGLRHIVAVLQCAMQGGGGVGACFRDCLSL